MIKVKALEWVVPSDSMNWLLESTATPFHYRIMRNSTSTWVATFNYAHLVPEFSTIEEAIGYCQAHHTQHVLSMIEGDHE